MIWSVVSKTEMEGCTSPVFKFQEETLGKDNIKLAVVDESDGLDFIGKDDIALLRTASRTLVDTIRKKCVRTTAEDYDSYRLALDKIALTDFLRERSINVARRYSISDIVDGKKYFVKPRNGNDSKTSPQPICHTKKEVEQQIAEISKRFDQDAIIEDYLGGRECTVACVKIGSGIYTAPIDVNEPFKRMLAEEEYSIRTLALLTFIDLKLKHHARIDIRCGSDGNPYVIDVNLIPSLGPSDKWTKCFEACNMSYHDALMMTINSAS